MGSGHRDLPDVNDPFNVRPGQQFDKLLETPVGMADGEERPLHVSTSRIVERAALVGCDIVGFVAFDFVLRVLSGGVVDVTFVIKVAGMNGDDPTRHPTSLGTPDSRLPTNYYGLPLLPIHY